MTSAIPFPQQADTLITGGHILCMDEDFTDYKNGAIAITDGKISAIGTADQAKSTTANEIIDAQGSVIIPGLINTHCHVAMTLFRGLADDRPLNDFLTTVWAAEAAHLSEETVYAGAALGIGEMLLSGVTHFVDMYSRPACALKAADKMGMSMTTGPAFVGFSRPDTPTWEDKLEAAEKLISSIIHRDDVQIMIMPHSSYTLDHKQLTDLVALAEKYDLRMHTHGAEAPSEMEQVAKMHEGARPIEALARTGTLERNLLIAHAVHLNEEEIALIAQKGATISHCPLSNAKLSSGMADIAALRAAGVTVSLGTDGASSGNDLDMWKAMRHASFLTKSLTGNPSELTAKELLAMATIEGAKALGLEKTTGSIEIGKHADLAMLDMSALHLTPNFDSYSTLAYAAGREDIHRVISKGKTVVKDRKLIADISEEVALVKETAEKIQAA